MKLQREFDREGPTLWKYFWEKLLLPQKIVKNSKSLRKKFEKFSRARTYRCMIVMHSMQCSAWGALPWAVQPWCFISVTPPEPCTASPAPQGWGCGFLVHSPGCSSQVPVLDGLCSLVHGVLVQDIVRVSSHTTSDLTTQQDSYRTPLSCHPPPHNLYN